MSDSIPRLFGESVRMIRRQREKTLKDMHDATGISVSHWSRIERGERSPSPRVADTIANALGVDRGAMLLVPQAVEKVLAALSTSKADKALSRLSQAFEDVDEQVLRLTSTKDET